MMNFSLKFFLRMGLHLVFLYNFLAVNVSSLPNNFLLMNLKHENTSACSGGKARMDWRDLEIFAEEIFKFQNDLQPQPDQVSPGLLVLVLSERVTQRAASEFVSKISNIHANVQFIYFQMVKTDVAVKNEIEKIVGILVNNRNTINNVVMFLENTTTILKILDTVSDMVELKYTAVHHVTEWIIVLRDFPYPISRIQESAVKIDFISAIRLDYSNTISISQKSRRGNFSVIARILTDHIQKETSLEESYKRVARYFNILADRKNIRKTGELYLKSKRSVLAGLRVPVAMASLNLKDWKSRFETDQLSNHEKYALVLLKYLATHLDFEYDIVVAEEDGFFGIVTNGSANGITGQLARREAALTTMPMAPISTRLSLMDFVTVQLLSELFYIIYRLPQQTDHVDMTYIRIFQPEFIYIHIAPVVLILLFRVGVRVFTQFHTRGHAPVKVSSWRSRNLLSFLRYACVREQEVTSWQFERILIASWHVFFFIMWSSYSAYLVTSFVAKPKELVIKSFKELSDNKNFKIGTLISLSATINMLQISENDAVKAFWKRLQKSNITDPLTLSPNISVHQHRIVAGGYIFTGGAHMLVDNSYVNILLNCTDIRYYPTTDVTLKYTSTLGLANGVFYKDTLQESLQSLSENGVLGRLKHTYYNTDYVRLADTGKINEDPKSVSFKRIALLLLLALCGILLSVLSLMWECIIQRMPFIC